MSLLFKPIQFGALQLSNRIVIAPMCQYSANAQGELSCGYWDGYIHEHDEKCYDSNGVLLAKKGQLLSSFALLRDDGTTASSCWIYAGSWTEQGNQMANRDNADPSGLGNTLGWAWA